MVMKVVAVRAVNSPIGAFRTEFRREQLCDDEFLLASGSGNRVCNLFHSVPKHDPFRSKPFRCGSQSVPFRTVPFRIEIRSVPNRSVPFQIEIRSVPNRSGPDFH